MPEDTGLFPIDSADLVGGAAMVVMREVYDPITGAKNPVPQKFEDVFNPFGPDYELNTGFWPLGAAREGQGTNYGRNVEATDWLVEQRQQAVAVDITDVPRTMQLQIAEVTAKHIMVLEDALEVEDLGIAVTGAPSGAVAQERVSAGSIDSLTKYQIVMIGLRRTGMGGDVTELPAKLTRGRFVATIMHQGSLARENVEYELQKGQMANIPVGFTAYPDPDQPHRKETVTWLFEKSGSYTKGGTYP
jgi:hypothetical protein